MLQSIRSRLTASHFAALLILAMMMQGVWYVQMRVFLHEHEREEIGVDSQQISRLIAEALDGYGRTLRQIGQGRPVLDYHETYRDLAVADYLNDFSDTFPLISYLDADGNEELRVLDGNLAEGGNSFADRPWFRRARELPGEPLATIIPADHEAGQAQVLLTLGIHQYFSNRFDGALLTRFDLARLLPGIDRYSLATGRSVVLLGTNGQVLLQETPAIPAGHRLTNLQQLPAELLPAAGEAVQTGATKLFGPEGFYRSTRLPELGLILLIFSPLQEYQAHLNGLLRSSSLMLPVLFLLLALYIGAAAKHFAAPLHAVAVAARRVAQGDLEQCITTSAKGEVAHLLSAFNQMVQQLRETTVSKTALKGIIDSMHEALLVVDDHGTIQRSNFAAEQLYARTQEQLQGLSLVKFCRELQLSEGVQNALLGRVEGAIDVELSDGNGNVRLMLISSSPLPDGGQVIVAQDISALKQAELELREFARHLEQSNRELEEFAYVASHDLQEPLRKIIAFGDRLSSKFAQQLGETGADYLARMQNASARMQTLISDLLAFSRVTTKGRPFATLELDTILAEVLEDLEIRIAEVGASIEVGPLPRLSGDALQMRQLFQNLVGNALKFHREGVAPQISISAEPFRLENRAGYRLTVSDNGIGFEEKYLDRIFGVFQRLHGRSSYEGSGIGLAICQKIVRRHGGSITARSTPEQGTRFIIELPMEQKEEKAA